MAIDFDIEDRGLGDDAHVVAVMGEIDLFTAPEFKQRVAAPIDAGCRHVIVDLTALTRAPHAPDHLLAAERLGDTAALHNRQHGGLHGGEPSATLRA